MERIVQLHRKIAPEFVGAIEERYHILRNVQYAQPVGRRALAGLLGMGERTVRTQVDFLKQMGLIDFSPLGMTITLEGQGLLTDLREYIRLLHGLTDIEVELAEKLNFRRVVVIPGDCDADEAVRRELGRAAAVLLGQSLQPNMVVAVSGGSTMSMMAESIHTHLPSTMVVPARGGLGEKVEYQANTIAAVTAGKLGGRYRLLHVPDGITEEAMETLLAADSNMRAVADMVRHANVLVHSIGNAVEMATRRGVDARLLEQIEEQGAVGEALGHYFTLQGKVVHITNSVGLQLQDLDSIGTVIAVAGGERKAAAILAVTRATGKGILVTDEGAARSMQAMIYQA